MKAFLVPRRGKWCAVYNDTTREWLSLASARQSLRAMKKGAAIMAQPIQYELFEELEE